MTSSGGLITGKRSGNASVWSWAIEGDTLLLKNEGGGGMVPSADSIYSLHFENRVSDELPGGTPPELPDTCGFSRYPLEVAVRLVSDMGSSGVAVRVEATGDGKEVLIRDALDRKADHTVLDGIWYPFLPGALNEVKRLLGQAGLERTGPITLRQYLQLRRLTGDDSPVDDLTEEVAYTSKRTPPRQPRGPLFDGNLYPYQQTGFGWLSMIAREDLGGVLADEMGLGKTIQIIALLAEETGAGRSPSLVVAPATLLENWRRELAKFAPSLSVLVHRGSSRTGFPNDLREAHVVITSYGTAARDQYMLGMVDWNVVVLDEAQAIKNPEAERSEIVRGIPRRIGLAVTGTPVENRLTDLWSIMDFAIPGFLGSRLEFESQYPNDEQGAARLEPIVSPVMLRRLVSEVAADLPERINIAQYLELDTVEAERYERVREDAVREYGDHATFASLIRLRMLCTHRLIVDDGERQGDPVRGSMKYRRLLEILEEILNSGEKALIFTSFTRMIDLLVRDLSQRLGIYTDSVDGRTPQEDRQPRIDRFSAHGGPGVLALNPRAAGTGLNITAANHVIHYNPEWNPALEDQASARAHRRGQTRPVTVHRLIYAGTVEEVMDQRLQRKRGLAENAVVGTDASGNDLADIMAALRITPA